MDTGPGRAAEADVTFWTYTRTPSGIRLELGRRFVIIVRSLTEQALRAAVCTRRPGHEGPCNGLPCAWRLEQLRTRAAQLEAPAVATTPRQEFRCDALHAESGARCELTPAHGQNHRGHKGNVIVQWPYPAAK